MEFEETEDGTIIHGLGEAILLPKCPNCDALRSRVAELEENELELQKTVIAFNEWLDTERRKVAELEAEVERLRNALKPFADLYNLGDETAHPEEVVTIAIGVKDIVFAEAALRREV